MVCKKQTKICRKYNKSHLENAVNNSNYHSNTLLYTILAVLEATTTLNPGINVINIFKSFILLYLSAHEVATSKGRRALDGKAGGSHY